MKRSFPWKRAALALLISAFVAAGCAKKQTVKSEGTAGGAGTTAAAPAATAPGTGDVKESAVKETPSGPAAASAEQPATAAAAAPGVAVTEEKLSQFDDVRFDFDKSEVKEDGRRTCQVVADYMKKNPGAKLQVEGHCDERGTSEYNMALGERRATAVTTYLVSLGVSKAGLSTVSFGKEKPLDPGHDEGAWAKNRRAHFVLK